jgi:uncharacterized protein YdaU (DUF1376 family)
MDRPPFFAFYPTDFASDINVEAMSTLQVGAYVLLLCKAWQAEPPASLPNDDQVLARLARVDAVTWAEIKLGVLAPFRLGTDGRLHSKRLRLEYDTAVEKMRARQERGQAAAAARWGRGCREHAASMPRAVPEQTPSNAIQKKREKKIKQEETPPPPFDTPAFSAAWAEWEQHRREKGGTLTPTAVKRQYAFLAGIGEERAVAAIGHSIRNNYTGIFEPKDANVNRPAGFGRDDGRRGRAVAEPGKYDHLDAAPWTPAAPGPGGPDLFGAAGGLPDARGSPPGAA